MCETLSLMEREALGPAKDVLILKRHIKMVNMTGGQKDFCSIASECERRRV